MYLFRLDDASDHMDAQKWKRVETIFDRYDASPIVGIIPQNEDPQLIQKYPKDDGFWDKARIWKNKGWRIALHGFNHVYISQCEGINPVNHKSEFAGVPVEIQKEKIRNGYTLLCHYGLEPDIFFAPAHTFDCNTLLALREESSIRIISDTVANDVYCKDGFYFIPQQTGMPRKLPLKMVTACLHPNSMDEESFGQLESFIKNNRNSVINAGEVPLKKRGMGVYDILLRKLYFLKRK